MITSEIHRRGGFVRFFLPFEDLAQAPEVVIKFMSNLLVLEIVHKHEHDGVEYLVWGQQFEAKRPEDRVTRTVGVIRTFQEYHPGKDNDYEQRLVLLKFGEVVEVEPPSRAMNTRVKLDSIPHPERWKTSPAG